MMHAETAVCLISIKRKTRTRIRTQVARLEAQAMLAISVQGRDSSLCWRSIMKVAMAAKIAVEVDFFWQDQATAAVPGCHGRFSCDGA
jgi:phosphopantothenate synthetase